MNVKRIDSLELPELEPYRTMRRTLAHREKGIFVAEGEKVVRRLVESNLRIISILMTPQWLDEYHTSLEKRLVEQSVFISEKEVLEQIVGYGLHQGIMAIGRIPDPPDIIQFTRDCHRPRLFVAVDGIANSENMGVIVRNCAALGAQILLAGQTSCDPYLRRSVRNSMGTVFGLPIVKVDRLSGLLRRLHAEFSIDIIAADPKSKSDDVSEVDLTRDVCLVFGSEGEGISEEVIDECSGRTRIPMHREVDSINVASSVGVLLFEAMRQRRAHRASK